LKSLFHARFFKAHSDSSRCVHGMEHQSLKYAVGIGEQAARGCIRIAQKSIVLMNSLRVDEASDPTPIEVLTARAAPALRRGEAVQMQLAAPPIELHFRSLQRSVRQLLRIRTVTARYGRQDLEIELVFKFAQPLPLGAQRIPIWAGFV